jgi:hypothetical protein
MGPVNWIAVLLAASAAGCTVLAWYGPIFGRAKLEEVGPGGLAARGNPLRTYTITIIALLVSSAMMGHMFARVGAETLQARPWLYFMMSGGLALAFVIPALAASYTQMRVTTRLTMIDAGFWLAAYLVMGGVFWLLG